MEAFHKLKVESPYEILEIEDIKISNNPNEHGRLYLKALLDDSINFKYAIEASTDDKISIYEETEDKEKSIIFNGTIQNIRTENINGIYYMEIEAYTSSFELDIKEKSRSFQDAEMSYDDLIKTILLDYKIYSFTQRMDKPMSIGRPLFQYKETDYEFLKRVASQIGLEINCDIINTNNVFYFGRPWGKEYKIEDNIDYEALKDIKKYRESLVHSPNFHDTDFFYYKIRTRKLMELGAQVVFKQKKFYINSYEAEYVRGELIYTYKLCRERGIWQEKLYNDKIKGISLEGEVLEVSGEKVKLHLDIDETQNKDKAAWFCYAPPTGNLMYSMPIVGTNANLCFSSERSEDPIVIGCIRKNGSSCESFSDVNNRYFSTESGNNLDMLPGAINFSRPGLSANFNDGSGINLSSSSSLNISAGYVGIYAGDITIKAKSKLEAKKGESSFISLENDFYNNAGIVMENGSDKASNGAFDDDPQKGATEAKKAKEAMESAVKVALAAVVSAVQGAMGKIGECLAGNSENMGISTNDMQAKSSNDFESEKVLDSLIDFVFPSTPCYAAEKGEENSKKSKQTDYIQETSTEVPVYNVHGEYNEGDSVKVKLNGKEFPATMTAKKDGSLYAKVDDYSGLVEAGIESGEKSKPTLSTGLAVTTDVLIGDKINSIAKGKSRKVLNNFSDGIHNILKACSGNEQLFEGLSEGCKSLLNEVKQNGKKRTSKISKELSLEELLKELNSDKSLCEKLNDIVNSDLSTASKEKLVNKVFLADGIKVDSETIGVIAKMPQNDYAGYSYRDFRSKSKGIGSNLGQINAYYLLTGKEKSLDNNKYNKILMDTVGPPPSDMENPHAHHIVYKSGNGQKQKALVEEGQEILRNYDIDPIEGAENLCWAPNIAGQHNGDNLQVVVDGIKKVESDGIQEGDSKEEIRKSIVESLEASGKEAADRERNN